MLRPFPCQPDLPGPLSVLMVTFSLSSSATDFYFQAWLLLKHRKQVSVQHV